MTASPGHIGSIAANKNRWMVGEARQQFSKLLRRSDSEPQLIYRRNRLIAAVVAMDESRIGSVTKRMTIADRFEEARALFLQEGYHLPRTRRRTRDTDFVRTLDALAGGHEGPE